MVKFHIYCYSVLQNNIRGFNKDELFSIFKTSRKCMLDFPLPQICSACCQILVVPVKKKIKKNHRVGTGPNKSSNQTSSLQQDIPWSRHFQPVCCETACRVPWGQRLDTAAPPGNTVCGPRSQIHGNNTIDLASCSSGVFSPPEDLSLLSEEQMRISPATQVVHPTSQSIVV